MKSKKGKNKKNDGASFSGEGLHSASFPSHLFSLVCDSSSLWFLISAIFVVRCKPWPSNGEVASICDENEKKARNY